jgi:hypothetical protein
MDHKHLTLVDPSAPQEQLDEFAPLPFYPWQERPSHLALDHDECATALHLASGDLPVAAQLLKVPLFRLTRSLRASPRLQRIREEALGLVVAKAEHKVIEALEAQNPAGDPDHRRQEWAATKILNSKAAQSSAFAPAPAGSALASSLTVSPAQRTITFRWRTDADHALTEDDGGSDSD